MTMELVSLSFQGVGYYLTLCVSKYRGTSQSNRHPAAVSSMEILVRCQGDDNEYVVVKQETLPENPYDVIYLLKAEFAPRSRWRDIAGAYFDQGKLEAGITVLEQATSDEVDSALKHTEEEKDAANKCSRLDLLAALGGAHLMHAETLLGNESARTEVLTKARTVFSRADKIDVDDSSIWVARGWGEFAVGKTASAKEWFDNAHNNGALLGTLGLAALELNRPKPKDPKEKPSASKVDPIDLLTLALRSRACPPGVWTGLGYALLKKRRFAEARDVSRRALHGLRKHPPAERLEALHLIALIEVSEEASTNANTVENLAIALREAYVECNGHQDTRILSLLAEMHFNAGNFEGAATFGEQAVLRAHESPMASVGGMYACVYKGTSAQALFQYGRALHHLHKYAEATKTFEKLKVIADSPDGASLGINPGFYFRLGMLKMSSGRKEDEQVAEECLDKTLKNPKNERTYPAMRALGFLLGRRYLMTMRRGRPRGGEVFQRALTLLKKGLSEDGSKEDIPSHLIYAALHEESHPEISVVSYATVIETSKEKKIDIDSEIWVNYAAVLARLGRAEEASEILNGKVDPNDDHPTICYNRGRVAEMMFDAENAQKNFEKIKEGQSHYMEAQIRLGVIATNRGNLKDAEDQFKKAMVNASSRSTAAAFLSHLYSSQKKFTDAQQILEQHRNECDYLTLAFAQFMHRFLESLGSTERKWRFLIHHVGQPVQQVLKRSKHNAFAANAGGVYLAESGEIDMAREAFTSAGSSKIAARAARINLAHTQVNKGQKMLKNSLDFMGQYNKKVLSAAKSQFEQADKLYGDAMKLSKPNTSKEDFDQYLEVIHYRGCAQYEARDFKHAKKTFQKVLRRSPTSGASWYNLALSLYECAVARIRASPKNYKEMLTAEQEFESAKRALAMVQKLEKRYSDPVTRTRLDYKNVEQWYLFLRQEMKKHKVAVVNARNDDEDRQRKSKDREVKIKEAMDKEREKENRKAEEVRKRQMQMEAAAKAAAEKLIRAEEMERQERERKARAAEDADMSDADRPPAPKQRKRKRKSEPAPDEEAPVKPKRSAKKSRKSKSRLQKNAGESSSSDEYASDIDVIGIKSKAKIPEVKKKEDESADEYPGTPGSDVVPSDKSKIARKDDDTPKKMKSPRTPDSPALPDTPKKEEDTYMKD